MTISKSGNCHVCLIGSTDNAEHRLRTEYKIRLVVTAKHCETLSAPVSFSLDSS